MKSHEFKTEKGEFVVVDLDSDQKLYELQELLGYSLEKTSSWFKLSEATEEDAREIIPGYAFDGNLRRELTRYKNYNRQGSHELVYFSCPIESLHSLLTSKGIDINNGNWYLFKK